MTNTNAITMYPPLHAEYYESLQQNTMRRVQARYYKGHENIALGFGLLQFLLCESAELSVAISCCE